MKTATSFFKNMLVTLALGGVVFAVGFEGRKRGLFNIKHGEQTAISKTGGEDEGAANKNALATPTPLPAHFPTVAEADFEAAERERATFTNAFKACWPDAEIVDTPSNEAITEIAEGPWAAPDADRLFERFFGKIKKREVLERTDGGEKIGFLFDSSVFKAGAAGSGFENGGKLSDLRFRAAGHMLHCENATACECL